MHEKNQNQPGPQKATPAPVRRKRTFPVTYVQQPDGAMKMYYAHEYAELLEQRAEAQKAAEVAEQAQREAIEAERAAGRARPAEFPESESALPTEPQNPDVPDPSADPPRRFPIDDAKAAFACFARSVAQATSSSPPPDFSRHSRRCLVCNHPDRDAIEGEFIRWRSPIHICADYGIPDRNSIYRHAHATGLLHRRRSEAARVLENVLEQAESCPIEQFDVITRATRLYARLDDDGKWYEPLRIQYIFAGQAPSFAGQGAGPGGPGNRLGHRGNRPPGPPLAPRELEAESAERCEGSHDAHF